MFSISLIFVRTFNGVCWTHRQRQAKLLLDQKMIAMISGNLHSMLIILCANDGESSQNCGRADQTSFQFSVCTTHAIHSSELLNLTELLCVGMNNWVKELATSDVIDVKREKVRSSGKMKGVKLRLEFTTRMHHQIGENWFNNRVCMKIATNWNDMHQSKLFMRFHSWDVTRAVDVACCCAFPHFPSQLPIGHQTTSSTRSDHSITIINLFTPTTPTVSHKRRFTFHEVLWLYFLWAGSLKLLALPESQQFMTQRKTDQRKFFLWFLNAV